MHVHNSGTANSIEMAIVHLMDDIQEYLIKSGVKPGCKILKDIRKLSEYEYCISDNKHKTPGEC